MQKRKKKKKTKTKKRPYIELQDSYTDVERNINKKGQKYRGKVTYVIYHSTLSAVPIVEGQLVV